VRLHRRSWPAEPFVYAFCGPLIQPAGVQFAVFRQ
jgi:hypothetical protein